MGDKVEALGGWLEPARETMGVMVALVRLDETLIDPLIAPNNTP
jgi:hypothetical protein